MTSRNYCFTINNPTSDVLSFPAQKVKCAVYQKEIGANGTPHFQGYMELKSPQRLSSIKQWGGDDWARAHLEVRRGTRLEAIEYSEKGETRAPGAQTVYWPDKETVDPTRDSNQGKRSDLTRVAELATSGASMRDIALQHPESWIKYYRGIRDLVSTVRAPTRLDDMRFLPWQRSLFDRLNGPIHPRKIIWIVDDLGNSGKSKFANFLVRNHQAVLFSGGKNDRIQHAYQGEKIALFDLPRAAKDLEKDFVPYVAIEAIKNGAVSRMYGERPLLCDQPHVVCFSNFTPDLAKLSQDRWDITYLTAADQFDETKLVTPEPPAPAPEVIEILSDFSDDELLTQWEPPAPAPEVPTLKRKHAELEIISDDEELDADMSDHEFLAVLDRNDKREERREKQKKQKQL